MSCAQIAVQNKKRQSHDTNEKRQKLSFTIPTEHGSSFDKQENRKQSTKANIPGIQPSVAF